MKKYLLFLTLLMLFLGSFSSMAAEVDIGYLSNWQINHQLHLSLYGSLVPEGNLYHSREGMKLSWNLDKAEPDLFCVLQGEKDCSGGFLSWMYNWPADENLDIQVGYKVQFLDKQFLQNILLRGYWDNPYGEIQLGGYIGSGEEEIDLQYLYKLEQVLSEKILVKTGVGFSYLWTESTPCKLTIPTSLQISYDLLKNTSLNLKAEDIYNLTDGTNQVNLSIFVQNDFDFLKESEEQIAKNPIIEAPFENNVILTEKDQKIEQSEKEIVTEIVVSKEVEKKDQSKSQANEPIEIIKVDHNPKPTVPILDFEKGSILYNGNEYEIETFSENGQILIPIRQLFEKLGGRVYWESELKEICIVLGELKILIAPDKEVFMRNGDENNLTYKMKLEGGHYYIRWADVEKFFSRKL